MATTSSFNSQQCFLLGGGTDPVRIDAYLALLEAANKPLFPTDGQGRPLVYCHGTKVKPYFRRCHGHTGPLSDWHVDWQSRFPNATEKTFKIQAGSDQGRDRRTDVDLTDTCVVEFQHSPICADDVNERKHDYKRHGKEVCWVVNGGDQVSVTKLDGEMEGLVRLKFDGGEWREGGSKWRYKSFLKYEHIYVDVQGDVYIVRPKDVNRQGEINVIPPHTRDEVAAYLKGLSSNTSPFPTMSTPVYQALLKCIQLGAGNGKTFSIIQRVVHKHSTKYDTFLIMTKMNSAKHTLDQELKAQYERGDLQDLKVLVEHNHYYNKYVYTFRRKGNPTPCRIIIATIDSFTRALGNPAAQGVDKFRAFLKSIVEEGARCSQNGVADYCGNVRLGSRMLMVCDELQDLDKEYADALNTVMVEHYVDFYAVGDKLQSLGLEHNAFTYLRELTSHGVIKVCNDEAKNVCRRFFDNNYFKFLRYLDGKKASDKCRHELNAKLASLGVTIAGLKAQETNARALQTFINHMVNFPKFDLPEISLPITGLDELEDEEDTGTPAAKKPPLPVRLFPGPTIIATETDKDKIGPAVDSIMELYKQEVEENHCAPNDFLIVTPFTQTNALVEALHQRIREFWAEREGVQLDEDSDVGYERYSVFHKSEKGTAINLSESDQCTRIVSTHAAKGDGRNVVFMIGFNESGLRLFSGDTGNLVYESHLHVAMTRVKNRLYIRVEENGDDFHNRIVKSQGTYTDTQPIRPTLNIRDFTKLGHLLRIQHEDHFKYIRETVLPDSEQHGTKLDELVKTYKQSIDAPNKMTVDMGHHNIRYGAMVVWSLLIAIRQEDETTGQSESYTNQFKAILYTVRDNLVLEYDTQKKYYQKLWELNKAANKRKETKTRNTDRVDFPLFVYRSKAAAYQTYHRYIRKAIEKVQHFLARFLASPSTTKPEDLDYMEVMVLYHMIEINQHHTRATFPLSDLYDLVHNRHNKWDSNLTAYTQFHHEQLTHLGKLWTSLFKRYPTFNFLYAHTVDLAPEDESKLSLCTQVPFLAYDAKSHQTVLSIHLSPQFNEMNYNDVLYHSFFRTHLLQHPSSQRNVDRFGGATNVQHVVMTFDLDEPYFIDWCDQRTAEAPPGSLVTQQSDWIRGVLAKNWEAHYMEQCSMLPVWWRFWCNRFSGQDKDAKAIAKGLVKQLERVKGVATFVKKAFEDIRSQVKTGTRTEAERMATLQQYDEPEELLKVVQEHLREAVEEFFGGDESESESESDEGSESESE